MSTMDKLDKVELVREKTGVSYEEAREALEANEYDVLDAIVYLERAGKTAKQSATYETKSEQARMSDEMNRAQVAYQEQSRRSKFGEYWEAFCAQVKRLVHEGLEMTFVAERNDARVVAVPLLFIIIGILAWGASIWLLIIGLFFGFRYHIEGASAVTFDVNDAMDKVADVAEDIKNEFSKEE